MLTEVGVELIQDRIYLSVSVIRIVLTGGGVELMIGLLEARLLRRGAWLRRIGERTESRESRSLRVGVLMRVPRLVDVWLRNRRLGNILEDARLGRGQTRSRGRMLRQRRLRVCHGFTRRRSLLGSMGRRLRVRGARRGRRRDGSRRPRD